MNSQAGRIFGSKERRSTRSNVLIDHVRMFLRVGLLLAHKSTLSVYADKVVVNTRTMYRKRIGGGRRGRVIGLSRESRKRLFAMLHTVRFSKMMFVTLTYPAVWPVSAVAAKKDLKEFRRRLSRLVGSVSGVWRMEFQKRGAPHYHVMLFDMPFVNVGDMSRIWYEVVGSGDTAHLACGLDMKLPSSDHDGRCIANYIGKYIAKQGIDDGFCRSGWESTGRLWGYWGIKKGDVLAIYELPTEHVDTIVRHLEGLRSDSTLYATQDTLNAEIFGDSFGTVNFAIRAIELLDSIDVT